nr:ABC transporter G family member 11 [Ipomoea batatas]
MVQFQDQWFEGQRKLVISSTKSDHKVTLAVNHPLASPSPPKLTVSYHERNWTPEYNIPPSKVWTLQPGLKHEPSTDILPTLGNHIIDDEVKWGNDIDFRGEFIYTPGYWEWAEDSSVWILPSICPGLLLMDDRDVTLAKGFQLHRQYEHFHSMSRATFPMIPTFPKKHVSDTYKAWLVDVHANLLENRVTDIVIYGDPNVTVREGITQEQRDQLDTLRKGKAPVQDAPHDQVPEHATQKRREEQVRHRSSDEDVDSDRNFKRNRRPSNEGSAGLHVSNDARSSNQHSSIGEVEHSDSSESLNQVAASQQSPLPSNPPHKGARPEPSHVSILPSADSFMSKYMAMIAGVRNDICEKLKETPAENVSSFKGSVERQIQLMKHNAVDLSSLENRVDVFFKKAEDYDKIRSQHSEAMPVETQVMELCLAQNALKDAQQKLSETQTLLSEKQKILEDSDGRVTLLEEAIKEAEKTIKEAEKTIKDSREELTRIHDERPKLRELVTEAQGLRDTSQEVVTSAEETVKRIQETHMLTSEDEDKFSLAEKDLEADKADLMNFRIV